MLNAIRYCNQYSIWYHLITFQDGDRHWEWNRWRSRSNNRWQRLFNNWYCRKKEEICYMEFFSVHKEDKSKAIYLTCSEKVSQGGNNQKHFNTTNLHKHLQGHSGKYKKFFETKATKARGYWSQFTGKCACKTKASLSTRFSWKKLYPLDHPCAKINNSLSSRDNSDWFAAVQCCRRYWFLSTNG